MSEGNILGLEKDLLFVWRNEPHIAKSQKRYLNYFQGVPGIVLDLGCGCGIMLGLLKEAGMEAYGVDLSLEAVQSCKESGFEAIQGDALGHLKSLREDSIGGIFCSHVIEHLEADQAIEMTREFHRVMKRGARLILITPDAGDLRTTERFWLDPTHVRPYPKKLLILLLEKAGFKIIKVTRDKESSRNFLVAAAKFLLKVWFMGFMFRGDLAVIAENRR